MLQFEGSSDLRMRLVFSLISEKPIKITKIRPRSENIGLEKYESSFLQLLDEITNGTNIRINETGTIVQFNPGSIMGGKVEFRANTRRGIGYYLEPLFLLAPFSKDPMEVRIHGVTSNATDPSPEMIVNGWLPMVKQFLGPAAAESMEVKVVRRGAHPEGGGEVLFTCRPVQALKPVQSTTPGKVFKIRGLAWTTKTSPVNALRMISGAKGILNKFLSDVYIHADHSKGEIGGLSPGFGITLVAETKHGARYTAECMSEPKGSDKDSIAEDIGVRAAKLLCDQIFNGGCVDSGAQAVCLSMMALVGGKDASQMVTGPLTDHAIGTLRLLKTFFQVTFHLTSERGNDQEEQGTKGGVGVRCCCFGSGHININKAIR